MLTAVEAATRLRDAIKLRLQEKTGWGRNEIARAVDDCYISVVSEIADELSRISSGGEV